jgi:hypothetical protein
MTSSALPTSLIPVWNGSHWVLTAVDAGVFPGEGGEGGEEGGPPDSPGSKLAGDDASSEPVSPTSATAADSLGGLQEDVVDGAGSVTPVLTAPTSPTTPSPMVVDAQETEPEVAITMLQDPLALRWVEQFAQLASLRRLYDLCIVVAHHHLM